MFARHVKLSRTSTQADVGTDFQNFLITSFLYRAFNNVFTRFFLGGWGKTGFQMRAICFELKFL